MQDNIFKNLRKYYQPNILFQAHVDLILEPIHELHKLYYDNVLESKQFIYQKGYELAELKVLNKIQEHVSMKSDTSPIFHPENLSSLLEKDQLFGTSKSAAAKLEKDTFNASQKTLTRVDKDINNILVDSYREGVGYKEVGRRLTKKFNQLKTFEAERIARTETHSAHELGTMQAFEDLDVEYLQWDAHLDNRVRETHEEINGEIIPLGGTFSNGLKYPGDKNGPIKEWINCRCHTIPYIMPEGKMAPNQDYFHENDLVDAFRTKNNEKISKPPINKEVVEEILEVPESETISEELDEFGFSKDGWERIQEFTKAKGKRKTEYGAIFDSKTGEYTSRIFHGKKGAVHILEVERVKVGGLSPAQIKKIKKEDPMGWLKGEYKHLDNAKYEIRNYVKSPYSTIIHNHPDTGYRALSGADIKLTMVSKNVKTTIAVSEKETWIVKVSKNFTIEEGNLFEKEYNKIFDEIEGMLIAQVKKKKDEILKITDSKLKREKIQEFRKFLSSEEFDDSTNEIIGEALQQFVNENYKAKGIEIFKIKNKDIPKRIEVLSTIKPVKHNSKVTSKIKETVTKPKKVISKVKRITKTNPADKAKGAKITKTEYGEGEGIKEIVYKDGTQIKFKKVATAEEGYYWQGVDEVTVNGKKYKFIGKNDSYTHFKDQDVKLSEEELKFVDEFSAKYATHNGKTLNDLLRGKLSINDLADSENTKDFIWLKNNFERYNNILDKTKINGDIVSVRIQGKNYVEDGANNLVDKGFTSTSVGNSVTQLSDDFGTGDLTQDWTYLTIVDNGTTGGRFQGNSINRYYKDPDGDFETELIWKTNKEFDILVRDDENHIMILKPKN